MTIEEIQKRKEEIEVIKEELTKQHELLWEKEESLDNEYRKLEEQEIELKDIKLEAGKYYIRFDPMDYHYNVFEIFFIKSVSKKYISYVRTVYRMDDYDPSFKTEKGEESYKSFVYERDDLREINEDDKAEAIMISLRMNYKDIEIWREKYIKEHNIEV